MSKLKIALSCLIILFLIYITVFGFALYIMLGSIMNSLFDPTYDSPTGMSHYRPPATKDEGTQFLDGFASIFGKQVTLDLMMIAFYLTLLPFSIFFPITPIMIALYWGIGLYIIFKKP